MTFFTYLAIGFLTLVVFEHFGFRDFWHKSTANVPMNFYILEAAYIIGFLLTWPIVFLIVVAENIKTEEK